MLTVLRELGALDGLDVRFAQALGRLAGVDDERVLVAAALANRAPRAGHVGIALAEAQALLAAELEGEVPELWDADAWAEAVAGCEALVTGPEGRGPLVWWGGALYLQRWWDYQRRLAVAVRARLGVVGAVDAAVLEELFGADPRVALQRRAAELAARGRIALIVGGPGTGKTAVVRKVLDLLGPGRRVLVAPTGKAASRLSESLGGDEASTIHKALGLVPGRPEPRRNAERPLDADVVVVDEASMVDLPLMTKLVEAVPPTARLILLGDPDQLASVEAGAVLGDLCRVAEEDPELGEVHVRLTHTWRYAPDSGIGRLAEAIRRGQVDEAVAVLEGSPDLQWHADPPSGTGLVRLLEDALASGYGAVRAAPDPAAALAALRGFRVLCAHRRGPTGVQGVHAVAERLFRDDGPVPLMITRNDAGLGVHNGDVGVRVGDRLWLDDGRALPPALLPEHEVVWATTVHKSQGSEYDHVWVMLPDRPSPLLTRELLYTAVTRARSRVTVVGRRELLVQAVSTVTRRMSGLASLLRG